jgi:starch-binding outer membrane protein, SusD/RagB family
MRNQMKNIFIALGATALFASCTKLDETVYDQIPSGEYFKTEEQVRGTLTTIYDEIRGDWNGKGYMGADRGWYDLNEISSDECMLPARNGGADWQDGGVWQQLYKHTCATRQ